MGQQVRAGPRSLRRKSGSERESPTAFMLLRDREGRACELVIAAHCVSISNGIPGEEPERLH